MEDEFVSGNVRFEIGGEAFEQELTIPASAIGPERMLPVLRDITHAVVDRGVTRVTEAGESISCKAACGACCRQPLLISEAEAFELGRLIETMPFERRVVIKDRFRRGREHFAEMGWFAKFDEMNERARTRPREEVAPEFVSVLGEYIAQGVACPFLEQESCSIYEDRPLICREYLVTSPAENCSAPRPDNTDKVPMAGSPSRALAAITQTGNVRSRSELLLIRLVEFVETHTEKFAERPGPAWAEDFFRSLTNRDEPGIPAETAIDDAVPPPSAA